MSESVPVEDVDPGQWADAATTYDTLAATYAEEFMDELGHKPFDRELLTRFAAQAGPGADATHPVCDVGCGPGHIGGYLAQQGLPVIGIDLSPGMVEEARRHFPALTFMQGDMLSLPRADESLAGIVSFYALIHIPRSLVPKALGEMRRVLLPGAPLLLAVHGGTGSLHATAMLDQPVHLHATLFGLTELSGLLEQAGFDVYEALQRDPYKEEHPTQRLYLWATRRA
jgi:ubiquinone/menaquinone biosynthesis C-methylase UbiE